MSSSWPSPESKSDAENSWPTETTLTNPPSPPTRTKQPEYTVINTIATLKDCLDALVKEMTMPPKTYSKAHVLPRTNAPYARADNRDEILSRSVKAPGPLFNVPKGTPELYVDAEGISLSRNGELSILIVHVETQTFSHTYLLHVHVLGQTTFATRTSNQIHSLKSILEDNRIAKVVFDCRMDSDALFGQHGVLLEGVIDLQLMRLATCNGGAYGLPGLEKCLTSDLNLSSSEQAW
ncbi:MAG: hypothetical protein Q9169_007479, partial [Polycauliona sp. 2 TL-2023]